MTAFVGLSKLYTILKLTFDIKYMGVSVLKINICKYHYCSKESMINDCSLQAVKFESFFLTFLSFNVLNLHQPSNLHIGPYRVTMFLCVYVCGVGGGGLVIYLLILPKFVVEYENCSIR